MSKVILDLDLGYYSENGVNLLCMEKQINMTQCQIYSCEIGINLSQHKILREKGQNVVQSALSVKNTQTEYRAKKIRLFVLTLRENEDVPHLHSRDCV